MAYNQNREKIEHTPQEEEEGSEEKEQNVAVSYL